MICHRTKAKERIFALCKKVLMSECFFSRANIFAQWPNIFAQRKRIGPNYIWIKICVRVEHVNSLNWANIFVKLSELFFQSIIGFFLENIRLKERIYSLKLTEYIRSKSEALQRKNIRSKERIYSLKKRIYSLVHRTFRNQCVERRTRVCPICTFTCVRKLWMTRHISTEHPGHLSDLTLQQQ